MTPAEFASFREFLANASGFQSAQFRELEFLLGIKDRVRIDWFARAKRLGSRPAMPLRPFGTPSSVFSTALVRRRCDRPRSRRERTDHRRPRPPAAIIAAYDDEGFANLCETLTDLDEGLQEWRYRHVMMVRRTIGTKPGTGGSDGAAYLTATLFRPALPDLLGDPRRVLGVTVHPSYPELRLFIAGEWCTAAETLPVINPSTEAEVGRAGGQHRRPRRRAHGRRGGVRDLAAHLTATGPT